MIYFSFEKQEQIMPGNTKKLHNFSKHLYASRILNMPTLKCKEADTKMY